MTYKTPKKKSNVQRKKNTNKTHNQENASLLSDLRVFKKRKKGK